jgi:DNA-binding NtrC family response regulator
MTVGSAPDNDLVLPFAGVSRHHARLSRPATGLPRLLDLGSKNGLVAGGRRHDELGLQVGLPVQLGAALLELREVASDDVELALAVPARPRGAAGAAGAAPPSGTGTISGGLSDGSPAAALALVRELERGERGRPRGGRHGGVSGDPPAVLGDAGTLLERARGILAATTLALLRLGSAGAAFSVAAVAGAVPDESTAAQLAALATQLDRPRRGGRDGELRTVVEADGGATLIAGDPNGLVLVAMFPSAALRRSAWARELFDYLAARLCHADSLSRESRVNGRGKLEVLCFPPGMVLGPSPAMRGLLDHMRATVKSRLDVLLMGETGTGKELFARMVHASGVSARGPFVALNCAAIPGELLEAELFGVQARVATGVDPRPGLFVQAEGGTVFLDEIGEMEERLQAKLLRVLQEREVLPVGGSQPKKINVRVISASNRDLAHHVKNGRFRADLYYRLRGLQFHIPPLRERREDIPPLVLAFVERAATDYSKTVLGVSRRALELLMQHDWPGNVRELASEIERAVLLCPDGGALESEHVGAVRWSAEREDGEPAFEHYAPAVTTVARAPNQPTAPTAESTAAAGRSLQQNLDVYERAAVIAALRASHGNKAKAARELGVTRNGLAIKITRLGIEPHDWE